MKFTKPKNAKNIKCQGLILFLQNNGSYFMNKNVKEIFSINYLKNKKEFTIVDISFIDSILLEKMAEIFGKTFADNANFKLNILYFSENNSFFEKLTELDLDVSRKFNEQRIIRKIIESENEFILKVLEWVSKVYDIRDGVKPSDAIKNQIKNNIVIRRNHCNHTFSAFMCDDEIWYAPQIIGIVDLDDYHLLASTEFEYQKVKAYADGFLNNKKLVKCLSEVDEEIIEVYEGVRMPNGYEVNLRRGTLPRSAFLTKDYKRYSVWEFIFNRHGQLLLHQRSKNTKDNRLLWDKSAGGHLNLTDSSSEETAKKELIEELFSADAEYEIYQKSDLDRITSFGEWNPVNRPIESYRMAFDFMRKDDVIMFRATRNGGPYTEDRVSKRKMCKLDDAKEIEAGSVTYPETVFISDVFYFIAPKGIIDTEEQVKATFAKVYERGAANAHKLVSIYELQDMVEQAKLNGTVNDEFTDDLVFMMNNRFQMLLEFSMFVKAVFNERN